MADIKSLTVRKLTASDDWSEWRLDMEIAFSSAGVFDWIRPDQHPPITATVTKMPEDIRLKALGLIRYNLDAEQIKLVSGETCPRSAWAKLIAAKESNSSMSLLAKMAEVFASQQGDRTVEAYGAFYKQMATSIKASIAAAKFTDPQEVVEVILAADFIRSLNPNFKMFAVSTLQLDVKELTIEKVVARASAHEHYESIETSGAGIVAAAHFTASKHATTNKPAKTKSRDSRPTCRHCEARKRPSGHSSDKCFFLVAYEEGKKDGAAAARTHGANATVAVERSSSSSCSRTIVHRANAASLPLQAPNPRPNASEWLLDSGATIHMCRDRSAFIRLRPVPATTVVLGSGQSHRVTEAGEIPARLQLTHGTLDVTLHDVLYTPFLDRNLLSMMQLAHQGTTCSTTTNGLCVIHHEGRRVGDIDSTNNLLPVLVAPTAAPSTQHSASASLAAYEDQYELEHCRFGHLHAGGMETLRTMADGVSHTATGKRACDACAKAKMHDLPHPRTAARRANQPLELVHTDVCGPFPESRNGYRYFITFIDDHTRFAEVALLKNKSEALDAFLAYQKKAENTAQRSIIAVRSDNGGEYTSKAFSAALSVDGIQRQLTAPYTPQENGVAERFNRTIVEMARSMLIHSRLSKRFWSHSVLQAVRLRNRMPTSAVKSKTPFEAWHGRRPSLSAFRVFGCRAFAKVPDQQRSKLDPTGCACIHLGSADGYKDYLLLDPQTDRTFVSRDVRFMENEFDSDVAPVGAVGAIDVDHCWIDIPVANPLAANPPVAAAPIAPDQHAPDENDIQPDIADHVDADDEPPAERDAANSAALQSFVDSLQIEHPELFVPRLNADKQAIVQSLIDEDTASTPKHMLVDVLKTIKSRALAQQPDRHDAHAATAITADPRSRTEATRSPDWSKWEQAEREEMESIQRAKVYTLTELPPSHRAIGCKFVYKTKFDEDGNIIKHKARLVAQGFTQREGKDFTETFSPVLQFAALRCMLAIVAHYDLELHQMDVKTAFLNGDIDHEIYMRQPEGYVERGKEHLVCKLNKSLYGLKQAGRVWYQKIHLEFTRMGFSRLPNEPCTYVRRSNGHVVIIGLYVDDLVLISNSTEQIKAVKGELSALFDMKDLGEARFILGIKIDRDRPNRKLSISQTEYIRSIVDRCGLSDSRMTTSTPMNAGAKLVKTGLAGAPESKAVDARAYQACVGSIMYAMLGTRPDIAHTVSRLSQYNSDPRLEHWNALMQLVRYLAATANHSLVYTGQKSKTVSPHLVTSFDGDKTAQPELIGFTDSDWANDLDTRRSMTGYLFRVAGGAISWKSRRQPTVALSTTEAEYMAASEAAREAVYWRMFLTALGFDVSQPTLIMSDNQGSIALSKNPEHHERTKHIDVRHHYLREQVESKTIKLDYISTDQMVADALTKPLARDRHRMLAKEMGLFAQH
jgi:transposase InsO family protein